MTTKREVEAALRRRENLNWREYEENHREFTWLREVRNDVSALPEGESREAAATFTQLTKGG